jgi:hypothetical protein
MDEGIAAGRAVDDDAALAALRRRVDLQLIAFCPVPRHPGEVVAERFAGGEWGEWGIVRRVAAHVLDDFLAEPDVPVTD